MITKNTSTPSEVASEPWRLPNWSYTPSSILALSKHPQLLIFNTPKEI
jgi:hypothetical protein